MFVITRSFVDEDVRAKVTLEDFLDELERENEYLSEGTSYRKETAKLSLDVAKKVTDTSAFYTDESAKHVVARVYPKLDYHRKNDVSKMLRVVTRNLYLRETVSSDVKDYVKQKMKSSKLLTLKR